MPKVAKKFFYKGKKRAAVITELKALDPNDTIDIVDADGKERTDVVVGDELAALESTGEGGLKNNFEIPAGEKRVRIEVPADKKPRVEEIECTINQVSPIRGSGERLYHVVTYTTGKGETDTINVNPGFIKSNVECFVPDACVQLKIEHRIEYKTQYVDLGDREAGDVPELKTHTSTGRGLAGVVQLTSLQKKKLENDMTTGMLIEKTTRIGALLEGYSANEGVRNSLAMILAGQKLT